MELALTLPIMFAVLLSCIEFTRLNILRNTMENACYEGARKIAVPGGKAADAVATAQAELNVVGARNAVITVTPTVITDMTAEVTVTVEVPFADNAWVSQYMAADANIVRSCTLTRERITP